MATNQKSRKVVVDRGPAGQTCLFRHHVPEEEVAIVRIILRS
jgi:hypothetical protein